MPEQDDPFAKYGGSEVKTATQDDPFAKYGGSEIKKNGTAQSTTSGQQSSGSSNGLGKSSPTGNPINKGRTSDNYFPENTPVTDNSPNKAPALQFNTPKAPDFTAKPVTLPTDKNIQQNLAETQDRGIEQQQQETKTKNLLRDPNYLRDLAANGAAAKKNMQAQLDDPGRACVFHILKNGLILCPVKVIPAV